MPTAPPEERALITLIADAERAGRREEALRLAEEKQALARRRLGVSEGGFTSGEEAAILHGMTRRERMERRAGRRREWAEGREAKAETSFGGVQEIADRIPLGQPILVGHHSERRARRDQDRIAAGMRRGIEHQEMAEHHRSRAAGIEDQLDRSIFSDDSDAIEALETRIAERDAEREERKRANAAWRKAGKPGINDTEEDRAGWAKVAEVIGPELTAKAMRGLNHQGRTDSGAWVPFSWAKPFDLTNIGARIRRDQKRLKELRSEASQP